MTVTEPTPARVSRPRQQRGEGQWAMGHLTPLNGNEQTKKDDDGLNVRARIENDLRQRAASTPSTPPTCAAGCAGGVCTPSAGPGSTAARPAILEPEELDDEYFMLRVRIDGGRLTWTSCAPSPRSRPSSRATPPTSPTGRTSSCTGSGSRTSRRSGGGWRRSGCPPPRRAATPRASSSARRSPASTPTRSSTAPRRSRRSRALHRQQGVLQPPAQVQDRDQRLPAGRGARDQRHLVRRRRPPRARPGLRPVGRRRPVDQPEASPSGSARSCRWRRSRTSGPASPASSATTATAGCATAPG